jgi:hypothetical protein
MAAPTIFHKDLLSPAQVLSALRYFSFRVSINLECEKTDGEHTEHGALSYPLSYGGYRPVVQHEIFIRGVNFVKYG